MSWTAVVPLKAPADRKTRLAAHLTREERIALSDDMARHVLATLGAAPAIGRVLLLSPEPLSALRADWVPDKGRGINTELACVRADCGRPMLVLHADLPGLLRDDVAALLASAEESGIAIAPDRHEQGTNAVALADARAFRFAFGPGSFRAHCDQAGGAVVRRPGLSFDIDTLCDLENARAAELLYRWGAF